MHVKYIFGLVISTSGLVGQAIGGLIMAIFLVVKLDPLVVQFGLFKAIDGLFRDFSGLVRSTDDFARSLCGLDRIIGGPVPVIIVLLRRTDCLVRSSGGFTTAIGDIFRLLLMV